MASINRVTPVGNPGADPVARHAGRPGMSVPTRPRENGGPEQPARRFHTINPSTP